MPGGSGAVCIMSELNILLFYIAKYLIKQLARFCDRLWHFYVKYQWKTTSEEVLSNLIKI